MNVGRLKALVSAERILSTLGVEGCRLSGEFGGADLFVLNGCGFLNIAKLEPLHAAEISGPALYNGSPDIQPGVIVSTRLEYSNDCDLWAIRVSDA